MDELKIPVSAIGRVGMVAMLRRVAPESVGRLVAVRLPVGFVSNLGTPHPVFAWQVLVLGEPVSMNGSPCREIVVADRCLKPVSEIAPATIEEMVKAGVYRDLDEALAKARSLFAERPMTEEELDAAIERAAEEALTAYAIEEVETPLALRDIGFTPSREDSCTLHWSGVYKGVELYVIAGPDMFDLWVLTGRCNTPRRAMWDECRLPPREARGRIALRVLKLWREAFGDEAPPPPKLELARHYEKNLADLRAVNIGLPTLQVDGEALRAVRRWLVRDLGLQPEELGPLPDSPLELSFGGGMLRLAVGERAYGCPAQGVWVGDCAVSLRTFLALPPWSLRGWCVSLQRSLDCISIRWFSLPLAESGPPAEPARNQ